MLSSLLCFSSDPADPSWKSTMKQLINSLFLYSLLKSKWKCILLCILFAFTIVLFTDHNNLVFFVETIFPGSRLAYVAGLAIKTIVIFLLFYVIISIFRRVIYTPFGLIENVKNKFIQEPKSVSRKYEPDKKQSKHPEQPMAPKETIAEKTKKSVVDGVKNVRKGIIDFMTNLTNIKLKSLKKPRSETFITEESNPSPVEMPTKPWKLTQAISTVQATTKKVVQTLKDGTEKTATTVANVGGAVKVEEPSKNSGGIFKRVGQFVDSRSWIPKFKR